MAATTTMIRRRRRKMIVRIEEKLSEVVVARPPNLKMRKLSWKVCLCCLKNL